MIFTTWFDSLRILGKVELTNEGIGRSLNGKGPQVGIKVIADLGIYDQDKGRAILNASEARSLAYHILEIVNSETNTDKQEVEENYHG